jgi:hypothetical protein
METSLCEKPERHAPRRLSDYLVLDGQMRKVHSLYTSSSDRANPFMKAGCGKTARPVVCPGKASMFSRR